MWGHVRRLIDLDAVPGPAAALWDAERDSFRFVSGGANVIFRFEQRGRGRYLRITHPDVRSRNERTSALDFLSHLERCGADVCAPVPSARGRLIEELPQREHVFMASAVAEVPGSAIAGDCRDPAIIEALGRSMASLHAAAERYRPAPELCFYHWRLAWRLADERLEPDDALARAEYERIDAWTRTLPEEVADFGLTHGDYNMGNALWDGERVWTIDFDEPTYHWFAADLARPFRDFSERSREERQALLEQLAAGYRALRPLEERWLREVPWFLRMKDLEIYAWFSTLEQRPGLLVGGQPLDEARASLRRRFERSLEW